MHSLLYTTLSQYSSLILVGGGTGGHVQPIVSVIQYLKDPKNPTIQPSNILWIGGANSQEEQAARENNVEFVTVPTLKLSTTRSPKVLLYPFVLIKGILEARRILKKQYVEMQGMVQNDSKIAVFSKGGPGSVAIGIAAWTLRIPLYIHESDTIPGRSNKILGKIATRIFLGFGSAKKYFNPKKCETIGQILSGVFTLQEPSIPTLEHSIFWKTNNKHLLVICGSQGARVIFEEVLKNLEQILQKHEVIIILGKLNTDMRKEFEEKLRTLTLESKNLNLLDWISQSDLARLIPDTDFAITRGSATTLAELTSLSELRVTNHELRMIIIPLPHAANNHQYWNAKEYEKLGHTVLEQKNLHLLTETIEKIGQNSQPSNI